MGPHDSTNPRHELVIALGDPAGIGMEVVLKALASPEAPHGLEPLLVGCKRSLIRTHTRLRQQSNLPLPDLAALRVDDQPLQGIVHPGQPTTSGADAGFHWLTRAVELLQARGSRALVTAPIAKHLWHAAGHRYPGQTERLAELAGCQRSSMLFTAVSPSSGWRLNTLLATTHIPLSQIPQALTPDLIRHKLNVLNDFCRRFTTTPHLRVAGLNPHAGEAGQLGDEEANWLLPLLDQWREEHPQVHLEGPVPPDTCWISAARAWQAPDQQGPDGILALYHDQGLIPVKLLAFDAAVNTTLELPFLRTSPDHGTAFDIASQGIASPDSTTAAIKAAWDLS